METNFEEANSNNLPTVDYEMIADYCATDPNYVSTESRGHKNLRASRASYGDNAIGYVQLQRNNSICVVKSRITPEHRVTKKGYAVTISIDEGKAVILDAKCHDCTAAEGGCKHAIAFLFWLHRRSEEPSVTEVLCYWKRSNLSLVGTSKKCIKLSEIATNSYISASTSDKDFFEEVVKHRVENAVLLNYYKDLSNVESLSIHQLHINYCLIDRNGTLEAFLQYCKQNMAYDTCKKAEEMTARQSKSELWYELRYGRVTASKMYEASRCGTAEGSLVNSIFGATIAVDTVAMKRGRDLEALVLKEVSKKENLNLKKCGLFLSPDYPFLGASPDAINDRYVIEVKCPTKEKNISTYINKEKITPKFKAQIQMQMHFSNRKVGLFIVADPQFEINAKYIKICELYDAEYCTKLISDITRFWGHYVFPILNKT